jgi:type IV secretory pathway TraG/TraD family ATPase VirD4
MYSTVSPVPAALPPHPHTTASQAALQVLLFLAVVSIPIVVGRIRSHASFWRTLTAPLLSIPVFLVGATVGGILGLFLWDRLAYVIGCLVVLFLGYTVGTMPPLGETRHHRGTIVEPDPGWRSVRRRALKAPLDQLVLAGIPVPPPDENKHFKLIGTTGTGKSTAIRELLNRALKRGDRAVIADPNGGYLERFYDADRGDVILNPFDARSLKWDVFGEIRNAYDFEQLARSLVPDGHGEDRIWQHYAQTFLAAVMRQAHGSGVRATTELYRLLVSAPIEELRMMLEGTAAQPFVTAGNDRMFGSTRSVTTTAVTALRFINTQATPLFSLRRWVREGRGVLFLPYHADQIDALRAMISTWMRIAILETMTLAEGDARLWFVVDELDALGPIDGLKDALVRLRKFGGRCVLGFQSIAQVSGTYGRAEAETIVENCGNTLILRCSAAEGGGTAQFASRLIGEREIIREQISKTSGWKSSSTTTTSEQHVTESAVLPSEIEQLPDLSGYLKIASMPNWKRVDLRW